MFYRYEILNNGSEDILYLYLTMNNEFSQELGSKISNEDITRRTINFIHNNKINFKGSKVYLIVNGIVVKTVDIRNNSLVPSIVLKDDYSNDMFLITLKMEDNALIEINLREYLLGVLATNYFPINNEETLKALCVLYRTYAYLMMKEKKYIEAYSEYALYKAISYYKVPWGEEYDNICKKLNKVIDETDNIFIAYNNYYILPFVHFSNTGKTYDNSKYPYLTSVNSLWDICSPYYINIGEFSYKYLLDLLNIKTRTNTFNLEVLEIDENNYIKKIKINDQEFLGEEFRRILNLKSLEMSFILNKDNLKIITKGWGNSLGMSVYGANELAVNGANYKTILQYYFPKCRLLRYKKELSKLN